MVTERAAAHRVLDVHLRSALPAETTTEGNYAARSQRSGVARRPARIRQRCHSSDCERCRRGGDILRAPPTLPVTGGARPHVGVTRDERLSVGTRSVPDPQGPIRSYRSPDGVALDAGHLAWLLPMCAGRRRVDRPQWIASFDRAGMRFGATSSAGHAWRTSLDRWRSSGRRRRRTLTAGVTQPCYTTSLTAASAVTLCASSRWDIWT